MADQIDSIMSALRKLEKKVPQLNGNNDFWKGYKEAVSDIWVEVEKIDNESTEKDKQIAELQQKEISHLKLISDVSAEAVNLHEQIADLKLMVESAVALGLIKFLQGGESDAR